MADPEYEAIEAEIAPHLVGTRTASAAQLAWFLQSAWRLEPEEIDDLICDGGGDKGIDALWVDDDLKEITVFQSKHRNTDRATQGDNDLRNLVGAAVYFESPAALTALLASGPNAELVNLLARLDVIAKVADGAHVTRLVFVTNAPLDVAGTGYVATMVGREPSLEVWDRAELASVANRTRRPDLRPETVTLRAASDVITADLDMQTKMAVALVPAAQLVDLPGIDDFSLFSRNVRLSLRRTRINRELASTVSEPAEHARFSAYHNGMTILTRGFDVVGRDLTMHSVGVVNGCQSLVVLRSDRAALTESLRVLVKVVQVDPTSDFADDITYRTNNQNPVDIRDQRSTDAIQRDLQARVRAAYGNDFGYQIRAGEATGAVEELENKSAAQLILAVYLHEPWNAVRKVRLFDEDYHRIFNRAVDAYRLRLLHELAKLIGESRHRLRPELQASFASVRLTVAYLVAKVLEETEQGIGLLDEPRRWLETTRTETLDALRIIVDDVVDSVNFYVESESRERAAAGDSFDAKVLFKSMAGVQRLETDVLRAARRQSRRDADYLFVLGPGIP